MTYELNHEARRIILSLIGVAPMEVINLHLSNLETRTPARSYRWALIREYDHIRMYPTIDNVCLLGDDGRCYYYNKYQEYMTVWEATI
jgi:hypothetical protein